MVEEVHKFITNKEAEDIANGVIYDAFISGAMSFIPEWNYPAFHKAAEKLRSQHLVTYNPAEQFNGATDLSWETYMRQHLAEVLKSKAIYVLPGWYNSKGSTMEVMTALAAGIPVRDLEGKELELKLCKAGTSLLAVIDMEDNVDVQTSHRPCWG